MLISIGRKVKKTSCDGKSGKKTKKKRPKNLHKTFLLHRLSFASYRVAPQYLWAGKKGKEQKKNKLYERIREN